MTDTIANIAAIGVACAFIALLCAFALFILVSGWEKFEETELGQMLIERIKGNDETN